MPWGIASFLRDVQELSRGRAYTGTGGRALLDIVGPVFDVLCLRHTAILG